MQQLMRWEPFRDTDEFFRSFMQPGWNRSLGLGGEGAGQRQEWMPPVDIRESDSEYTVLAEMPGMRREDVKVRIEDDVLTLEGERRLEREAQGERSHRIERAYGHFCRRFTLPDDTDSAKVSADCKDGIVTVHIPKREVEKPKTREISVE
jgi:HSP20 family protein